MTKEEIFSFMKANPICYLATAEGERPHVRPMGMYSADERGILIQLSTRKGMYREILQNPRVELCFNGSGKTVRVSGIAEFIEDQGFKEEVVKSRSFLKPLVEAHGWIAIKVLRVSNPVATAWTMSTNLDPKVFINL